jgi:hypothetical protein
MKSSPDRELGRWVCTAEGEGTRGAAPWHPAAPAKRSSQKAMTMSAPCAARAAPCGSFDSMTVPAAQARLAAAPKTEGTCDASYCALVLGRERRASYTRPPSDAA